jgi:UTP--glucose-1-phosphate uridylyltransferase
VIEKPTATEAEQRLLVPGLRAGHYLCFFGMHVLTPVVMDILARQLTENATQASHSGAARPGYAERAGGSKVTLSPALAELARRERYLALERAWWRYDVGVKYGLLLAQLALALNGRDRSEVLVQLLELLAQREHLAASGL